MEEHEYRKGQEVEKSLGKRGVYRNEERNLYVFEERRATGLPEKNKRVLVCVQRSELHGESWRRFAWPRMGG